MTTETPDLDLSPNHLADKAVGRCTHVDLNAAIQRGGHDYLCASCCRDAIDGAQTDERIAKGELLRRAEAAEERLGKIHALTGDHTKTSVEAWQEIHALSMAAEG
jgi:hypothetical protein